MHFRIQIVLKVFMPIEVVGFKIRKNGIITLEWLETLRHKARNFEHNITSFLSFLKDFSYRFWKWNIKISWEIDFVTTIFIPEKLIKNPRCRRFAISSSNCYNTKVLRKKWVYEVKLWFDFSWFVHNMMRRDPWRRDYKIILSILYRICIILYFVGNIKVITESCNPLSHLSFSVNKYHTTIYIEIFEEINYECSINA